MILLIRILCCGILFLQLGLAPQSPFAPQLQTEGAKVFWQMFVEDKPLAEIDSRLSLSEGKSKLSDLYDAATNQWKINPEHHDYIWSIYPKVSIGTSGGGAPTYLAYGLPWGSNPDDLRLYPAESREAIIKDLLTLRQSQTFRKKLCQNDDAFLSYIGLRYDKDDQRIIINNEEQFKKIILQPDGTFDHNLLRITRRFESLLLFGEIDRATALFSLLTEQSKADTNVAFQRSYAYWLSAYYDNLDIHQDLSQRSKQADATPRFVPAKKKGDRPKPTQKSEHVFSVGPDDQLYISFVSAHEKNRFLKASVRFHASLFEDVSTDDTFAVQVRKSSGKDAQGAQQLGAYRAVNGNMAINFYSQYERDAFLREALYVSADHNPYIFDNDKQKTAIYFPYNDNSFSEKKNKNMPLSREVAEEREGKGIQDFVRENWENDGYSVKPLKAKDYDVDGTNIAEQVMTENLLYSGESYSSLDELPAILNPNDRMFAAVKNSYGKIELYIKCYDAQKAAGCLAKGQSSGDSYLGRRGRYGRRRPSWDVLEVVDGRNDVLRVKVSKGKQADGSFGSGHYRVPQGEHAINFVSKDDRNLFLQQVLRVPEEVVDSTQSAMNPYVFKNKDTAIYLPVGTDPHSQMTPKPQHKGLLVRGEPDFYGSEYLRLPRSRYRYVEAKPGGTLPGGVYQERQNKEQWMVKPGGSPGPHGSFDLSLAEAIDEVMMGHLIRKLGISAPEIKLIRGRDDSLFVASQMIDKAELYIHLKTQDQLTKVDKKALQKMYVAALLLGNSDFFSPDNANIVFQKDEEGIYRPYQIDPSFMFSSSNLIWLEEFSGHLREMLAERRFYMHGGDDGFRDWIMQDLDDVALLEIVEELLGSIESFRKDPQAFFQDCPIPQREMTPLRPDQEIYDQAARLRDNQKTKSVQLEWNKNNQSLQLVFPDPDVLQSFKGYSRLIEDSPQGFGASSLLGDYKIFKSSASNSLALEVRKSEERTWASGDTYYTAGWYKAKNGCIALNFRSRGDLEYHLQLLGMDARQPGGSLGRILTFKNQNSFYLDQKMLKGESLTFQMPDLQKITHNNVDQYYQQVREDTIDKIIRELERVVILFKREKGLLQRQKNVSTIHHLIIPSLGEKTDIYVQATPGQMKAWVNSLEGQLTIDPKNSSMMTITSLNHKNDRYAEVAA